MTLWTGRATSEQIAQTCKNCGHKGSYHLNTDLQRCIKFKCTCEKFEPAFVEKDEDPRVNQDLIDKFTDIKLDTRLNEDERHDISKIIARLLWDQA